MNKKIFIICKVILWLSMSCFIIGCTSKVIYKKPPYNAPSDDATIKLAEAADSVSDSMLEMARIEKVIIPPHQDNTEAIPYTQNLLTRATVDWSGPIGEITYRIANAAHYRLSVLGKEPAIPILVSLNVKDQSLTEILRNIDYQAGIKAAIRVYDNKQMIELRYAKIYA